MPVYRQLEGCLAQGPVAQSLTSAMREEVAKLRGVTEAFTAYGRHIDVASAFLNQPCSMGRTRPSVLFFEPGNLRRQGG